MGHLNDSEYVLAAAKHYHDAAKKQAQSSNREAREVDATPARIQKLRDATATATEATETAAHELHCRLVEVGLAQPEPERYGTFTRRWFGNEVSYTRRAPKVGGR